MLTSIALIFLIGISLGSIFKNIRMPSLIGMIITGIIIGPYILNLIDDSIMNISIDLRQIALIIILLRAGFSLNIKDLIQISRPALLMCFVPACFEILGVVLIAPKILEISVLEAAIIGSVIAAVSPAVVVPKMINLIDKGYGTDKKIPQLIMAGASVDDVFVIVLFTSFTALSLGSNASIYQFIKIPVSIILGVIIGGFIGFLLSIIFKKVHIKDSIKVIIILCVSFLLVDLEKLLENYVPFSGLLAVMSIGLFILKFYPDLANRISPKFSKLWIAAEVILFVLVGASVDIKYTLSAGLQIVFILITALIFRMAGIFVCLIKTNLNKKEKLFCMLAYIPKATVQAAIGGLPLAMGLPCGEIVLSAAIISILLTAPLGALLLDLLHTKLLNKTNR